MIARLTGKKEFFFHILKAPVIFKNTPQHMNNDQATWFSTWPLAPSGFVFLVTVMNHLLDCCFPHQHVTQVGTRASFGLSWICRFIKTGMLELDPEKHNSLLQPPSARCHQHQPGLPPIRRQRSIEGLQSLLSLLFRVPAAPLQLHVNSWRVPEDKSPFNLSQADAGPRV